MGDWDDETTEWNAETAEWYAEKYGEYATNRLAVDALDLTPNAVIVDVGCGTGAALRRAADRVTAGRLVGVDPVPRMVAIARERCAGTPIEILEAPAEALPIGDAEADVVLAFDSVDHWTDPAKALGEIRRVLRAGGRFVVVKDGGVPFGGGGRAGFLGALADAGFVIADTREVEEDGVVFTMWTCGVGG